MHARIELKERTVRSLDQIISWSGIIAGILARVVLCVRVVGMPLSFDESLHAHYSWLVSIGRIPHKDFWCHYPALGYVLVRPCFLVLPESI